MRTTSVSACGAPPQYAGFLPKTRKSSCCQRTNFHGPLPTGFCPKSGAVGAGTIAATAIARNLGNTASGSVNSIATAVSPSGWMPHTSPALREA